MEGVNYGDIIFFALVAVYLAVKLSSTLGKRNDEDTKFKDTIEPYSPQPETIPNIRIEEKIEEVQKKDFRSEIDDFEYENEQVKETISQILEKDRSLSLLMFVEGAKSAFDMVLKAFTEGDKNTLKELLSSSLYRDFSKKIDEFKKKDLTADKSLVSITLDKISNAKLLGNSASITLKFITEQINFVKDEEGNIVDGDQSFIETIEDEWEFERNLKSSNPNWQIIAV